MIWLGHKSGYLSDWATQQWVRATGRRISLAEHPWLDGPVGNTKQIGKDFFAEYAQKQGLEVIQSGSRGLLENFCLLSDACRDSFAAATAVKDFYERTSDYELDAFLKLHYRMRKNAA